MAAIFGRNFAVLQFLWKSEIARQSYSKLTREKLLNFTVHLLCLLTALSRGDVENVTNSRMNSLVPS
jgi:hypothetical protein